MILVCRQILVLAPRNLANDARDGACPEEGHFCKADTQIFRKANQTQATPNYHAKPFVTASISRKNGRAIPRMSDPRLTV